MMKFSSVLTPASEHIDLSDVMIWVDGILSNKDNCHAVEVRIAHALNNAYKDNRTTDMPDLAIED